MLKEPSGLCPLLCGPLQGVGFDICLCFEHAILTVGMVSQGTPICRLRASARYQLPSTPIRPRLRWGTLLTIFAHRKHETMSLSSWSCEYSFCGRVILCAPTITKPTSMIRALDDCLMLLLVLLLFVAYGYCCCLWLVCGVVVGVVCPCRWILWLEILATNLTITSTAGNFEFAIFGSKLRRIPLNNRFLYCMLVPM